MDAGTKAVDHYAERMAPWRFWCRDKLLHIIRAETPVLARIQDAVRRPWLDSYFAVSANIGTHTFYMVMLPVFFWYGNPALGLEVIWVLALGVYISGFAKDLLCLPRPQSPPLHRISMSGSAVLEYGWPSTHTANVVSTSLVLAEMYPNNVPVTITSVWLLVTLVTGRLYNGMHGPVDLISGAILGGLSYELRRWIAAHFSEKVGIDNALMTALILGAIAAVPEPVDDCPCFDDSVAFGGTILGIIWTLWFPPWPGVHFDPSKHTSTGGMVAACLARFVVGVAVVVTWRVLAKRLLLRILPPIWRFILRLGIDNPRRFFLPASKYTKVPSDLPDDSVPDSRQQITTMIHRIRKSHGRSVSIGPQSEADLYELRAHPSGPDGGESIDADHADVAPPRVRYDVEVVMRLIAYGGIAPMVVIVSPMLFNLLNV